VIAARTVIIKIPDVWKCIVHRLIIFYYSRDDLSTGLLLYYNYILLCITHRELGAGVHFTYIYRNNVDRTETRPQFLGERERRFTERPIFQYITNISQIKRSRARRIPPRRVRETKKNLTNVLKAFLFLFFFPPGTENESEKKNDLLF